MQKEMKAEIKKEFERLQKEGHSKLTHSQKIADKLTAFTGSWTFIFILVAIIVIWIVANIFAAVNRWDPYPFILLNLVLGCVSLLLAPIILMSQNRESQRDRERAEHDYYINRKAEREIENMQQDLEEIKKMLKRR